MFKYGLTTAWAAKRAGFAANGGNSPKKQLSEARTLLNKALGRQGLSAPPNGFKEKWSEDGYDYEVRIYGPQSDAPPNSNSANKTTFRVARRSQSVDANGQGQG